MKIYSLYRDVFLSLMLFRVTEWIKVIGLKTFFFHFFFKIDRMRVQCYAFDEHIKGVYIYLALNESMVLFIVFRYLTLSARWSKYHFSDKRAVDKWEFSDKRKLCQL